MLSTVAVGSFETHSAMQDIVGAFNVPAIIRTVLDCLVIQRVS